MEKQIEKNISSYGMTKYGRLFQTTLNMRKHTKKHPVLHMPNV